MRATYFVGTNVLLYRASTDRSEREKRATAEAVLRTRRRRQFLIRDIEMRGDEVCGDEKATENRVCGRTASCDQPGNYRRQQEDVVACSST